MAQPRGSVLICQALLDKTKKDHFIGYFETYIFLKLTLKK